MDRGYNDYKQFMWLTQRRAKFVTHIKDNTQITRLKDDIIEEKDSYGGYGFQFTQEQARKVAEILASDWCNGMTQIWTVAVVALLIEILRRRVTRYRWTFSRLLKFVGLHLLTSKKLDV